MLLPGESWEEGVDTHSALFVPCAVVVVREREQAPELCFPATQLPGGGNTTRPVTTKNGHSVQKWLQQRGSEGKHIEDGMRLSYTNAHGVIRVCLGTPRVHTYEPYPLLVFFFFFFFCFYYLPKLPSHLFFSHSILKTANIACI